MASLLKSEGERKQKLRREEEIKTWIQCLDHSMFFCLMKGIQAQMIVYAPFNEAYFSSLCHKVEMIARNKGKKEDRYQETKYLERIHYKLSGIVGLSCDLHVGISYQYFPKLVTWTEGTQAYQIQVMIATTAEIGFYLEDYLCYREVKTFSEGDIVLPKLLQGLCLQPIPCLDREIKRELRRGKRHEITVVQQSQYSWFDEELYLILGNEIPREPITKTYQKMESCEVMKSTEPLHSMLTMNGKVIGRVTMKEATVYRNIKRYSSMDGNFLSLEYQTTWEEKNKKLSISTIQSEKLNIQIPKEPVFSVLGFPTVAEELSLQMFHYALLKEKVIRYRDQLLPFVEIKYEVLAKKEKIGPWSHFIYETPVIDTEPLTKKGWQIQIVKEEKKKEICAVYYDVLTPRKEAYQAILYYQIERIEVELEPCKIVLPAFVGSKIKLRLNRCFLDNPCEKDTEGLEKYCHISNIREVMYLVKKHNPDFVISQHTKSEGVKKRIDKSQIQQKQTNGKNLLTLLIQQDMLLNQEETKFLSLKEIKHEMTEQIQEIPIMIQDEIIGKIKPCNMNIQMQLEDTMLAEITLRDRLQQGITFYQVMDMVLEKEETVRIHVRAI